MGHKESKDAVQTLESTVALEDFWAQKDHKRTEDLAVVDLTRSTQADREQNSLGLPDDVVAYIAEYLEIEDIATAASVCKTWRRILYKDVVWRSAAKRYGIELCEGSDVRTQVVMKYGCRVGPESTMIPFDESKLANTKPKMIPSYTADVFMHIVTPSLGVCLSQKKEGQGKRIFLATYTRNSYEGGYDPAMFKVAKWKLNAFDLGLLGTKSVTVNAHVLSLIDMDCMKRFFQPKHEVTHVVIVMDTFNRPGRFDALKYFVDVELEEAYRRADIPLVIVRSKSDLDNFFYEKNAVMQWCRQRNYPLINVSSKKNLNVARAIHLATRMGLHHRHHLENIQQQNRTK